METEFKYRLNDEGIFNAIVENCHQKQYSKDATEIINMKAEYFDTDDFSLRNKGIAYRIRYEDDRIIATIKWDIAVKDGLHIREEINLVVNDEYFAEHPDIELFKSSDAYEVLYDATQGRPLVKAIDMEYTRRQIMVDTGKSISCISEDRGCIHHVEGDILPIYELEIEWYHGDEGDFKALAADIQSTYKLESEDRSKLQRAFA